ncbi:nuclear transport factor 2 family protein [Modestobacter roseus]|uniref:nuclear transport factor 2 family protein n=1 Tax=Modestobacter roseus TaxID=1181884 RepID=UPI00129704B6|nr:nuclear transport factor 2 family protein [Modestobacter roseus]MQA32238.1 nuclear transport factor 2 family protein [Modestobacter roseus]
MDVDQAAVTAEASAATRAAVLEHVAAFNAHDTDRLLAGLHEDVVWATGSDLFRGTAQLRDAVFDVGLWEMRPSLAVRTLLVEGGAAAGTFREVFVVGDERREVDIAVFVTVHDAVIRTVTVFREGSADVEPPRDPGGGG